MLTKPERVIGRKAEWQLLSDFVLDPQPRLRLGVVSGRRRVGKSFLLRALVEATRGLYVMGVAEEDAPAAKARLARAIANYAGLGAGFISPQAGWEELLKVALDVIVERVGPGGLLVIDELPYWMAHSPELPGLLQLLYDKSQSGEGPSGGRLIVCGSAISVMNSLLSGTKALRGRASVDLRMRSFDLPATARLWGVHDHITGLYLHSTLGGAPGYRELTSASTPQSVAEFDEWVTAAVLNAGQALYSRSETEYLLREDPKFTGSVVHYAILGAVAAGASSPAKIGARLERDRTALTRPIEALTEAGYLRDSTDPLWQRRPVITLADPIVRFHYLIAVPHLDLIEAGLASRAWELARQSFTSGVLGPHFEDCARQWLRTHHVDFLADRPVSTVASSVVNDRSGRAKHEIDVVAVAGTGSKRDISLIGEAKATVSRRGLADLRRLEELRDHLVQQGQRADRAVLSLFSLRGFQADLVATAQARDDVLLVDLAVLLGQSEPIGGVADRR